MTDIAIYQAERGMVEVQLERQSNMQKMHISNADKPVEFTAADWDMERGGRSEPPLQQAFTGQL